MPSAWPRFVSLPLITRGELSVRRGVYDAKLVEFGNMLQELRGFSFAQELRTPMPVSVKRLNKMWDAILREH